MLTNIKISKPHIEESEFPTLMVGISGAVWLMGTSKTGTIVNNRDCRNEKKLGDYSTKLDLNNLIPYNGTITLKNTGA